MTGKITQVQFPRDDTAGGFTMISTADGPRLKGHSAGGQREFGRPRFLDRPPEKDGGETQFFQPFTNSMHWVTSGSEFSQLCSYSIDAGPSKPWATYSASSAAMSAAPVP